MQVTVAVNSVTVEITDDESKYCLNIFRVSSLKVVPYFDKFSGHLEKSFTLI